jgi:hypothetical protein
MSKGSGPKGKLKLHDAEGRSRTELDICAMLLTERFSWLRTGRSDGMIL